MRIYFKKCVGCFITWLVCQKSHWQICTLFWSYFHRTISSLDWQLFYEDASKFMLWYVFCVRSCTFWCVVHVFWCVALHALWCIALHKFLCITLHASYCWCHVFLISYFAPFSNFYMYIVSWHTFLMNLFVYFLVHIYDHFHLQVILCLFLLNNKYLGIYATNLYNYFFIYFLR